MKKKRQVTVRIETERMGFPFPFMPFLNEDDDEAEDFSEASENDSVSSSFPSAMDVLDAIADLPDGEKLSPEDEKPERSEFFSEGRQVTTDDRVEIIYEESVLTGLEGSVTSIGFSRSDPSVVTMMRQGFVNTAFVFEEGKRHICVYDTPFSSFEICVHALKVKNRLLDDGTIELDYLTELHGARTERCKMKITVE